MRLPVGVRMEGRVVSVSNPKLGIQSSTAVRFIHPKACSPLKSIKANICVSTTVSLCHSGFI